MEKVYTVAEIEVVYRTKVKKQDRHKVKTSEGAHQLIKSLWPSDIEFRETAILLCLNRAGEVMGYYRLSSGGLGSTVIDSKIVFSVALSCMASSIILAHNHPSGNITPSEHDKKLTRQIRQAGELLDITLSDHIIITGDDDFYSFADNGEL